MTNFMIVLISVFVGSVGCVQQSETGGIAPDVRAGRGGESYVSGQRIRVKMLTTADGARVPMSMYDSERDENCGFAYPGRDGIIRCLPSSIATLDGRHFADAACTAAVVVVKTCEAPKYLAEFTRALCPDMFSWGAIYMAEPVQVTTYYQKDAHGTCRAVAVDADSMVYGISGLDLTTSFQPSTLSIE